MRLFIGIEIETNLSNILNEIKVYKGRIIEVKNYHITLSFLGDIDNTKVEQLTRIIDSLSLDLSFLQSYMLETFANQALVLKFEKNDKLMNYQRTLNEKLKNNGFIVDNRVYTPHLTLMRKCREAVKKRCNIIVKLKAIHLYQSILSESGATYQSLFKKSI